jgi:hypothetical protein
VHFERAVFPLEDLDASDRLDRSTHLLLMGLARAVDDHVLVEVGGLHLEPLEAGDVAAHLADRHGDLPEHAGKIGHASTQRERNRRESGFRP